jgi:DNA-binding GntR family transcriptional regulator
MAAKHFMIYYQTGSGTYVVTEPRPWARENQHHFPNYNFQQNNHPTTEVIEAWLIENRSFQRVVNNNSISLIQNVDPNLVL